MTSNYDSHLKNDHFLATEGCWVNVMLQKAEKQNSTAVKFLKFAMGACPDP